MLGLDWKQRWSSLDASTEAQQLFAATAAAECRPAVAQQDQQEASCVLGSCYMDTLSTAAGVLQAGLSLITAGFSWRLMQARQLQASELLSSAADS